MGYHSGDYGGDEGRVRLEVSFCWSKLKKTPQTAEIPIHIPKCTTKPSKPMIQRARKTLHPNITLFMHVIEDGGGNCGLETGTGECIVT